MQYTKDISPKECWEMLEKQDAILIDVRTKEECIFVGTPKLQESMKPIIFHPWQNYPKMNIAPDYATTLEGKIEDIDGNKSSALCFLCRSGGRSKHAASAMFANGYEKCFNIVGGFEGDKNENDHRNTKNCWKYDGLPWLQN